MGDKTTKVLGLGKLGISILFLSIILIIGVYYYVPNIEDFFETEILIEGKDNINIFIRLYGGFLASSAMTLTAQLVIWILQKSALLGLTSTDYSDDVKTVRNFSVYALLVLAGILYFIAGKSVVRI